MASIQDAKGNKPGFPTPQQNKEGGTATESVRTLDGAEAHNASAG